MPSNPFRRRGPSSGSSLKGKTPSSSRQGITIASDGPMTGAQRSLPSSSSRNHLDPSNVLLPESDYRTSLIMPHLTRRFTLLRAPDGTMVTPDAMRAHLRAQRARARAAGVPGTQYFLTEEEEDEIIDQLKRQTRMEEMDAWEQAQAQAQEQADEETNAIHFGGTDGFGSWATAYPHRKTDSKIDASLTESLGNLRSSTTSSSQEGSSVGGFFTSRSTARDLAYIKEVEKSRAKKDATSEHDHDPNISLPHVQEEEDEGLDADEKNTETEGEAGSEEAMPGDFLAATHRESRRLSASEPQGRPRETKIANKPSLLSPATAQFRHSQLLTNLTPEAFNRVSTALEEVYDMVSGHGAGGEMDSEGADDEDESDDDVRGGKGTLLAYDTDNIRTSNTGAGDLESVEATESLDNAEGIVRGSIESETNSFRSARSDVAASALEGHGLLNRSDAFAGIGAAAQSGRAEDGYAPPGWHVVSSRKTSSRTGSSEDASARRAYPSRHAKGSTGSTGSASLASSSGGSPSSRKANLVSLDYANGKMKPGPLSPRSNAYATLSPVVEGNAFDTSQQKTLSSPTVSTDTSASVASPLSAGFHLAGAQDKSAAAAAATAAGVAAASYVAHAQHQQHQQLLLQRAHPAAEDTTATPTSEVTLGVRSNDDETGTTSDGTPVRPSAAENKVLSANAIAARSQHYFPTSSARSMQNYAAGFRPTLPSPGGTQGEMQQSGARAFVPPQTPPSASEMTHSRESTTPSSSGPTQSAVQVAQSLEPKESSRFQPSPSALNVKRGQAVDTLAAPTSAPGLSPVPPSDPEEASKWRERYGMSSTDAQSVRSGISMQISEDDQVDGEEVGDDEDVWARVARNTSPRVGSEKPARAENDESNVNQSSLESTGMDMDALYQIQSDLIRSASAKQSPSVRQTAKHLQSTSYPPAATTMPSGPPPPVPSSPPLAMQQRASDLTTASPKASIDVQMQSLQDAQVYDSPQEKLEKARGRARLLAERMGNTHTRTASGSLDAAAVPIDDSSEVGLQQSQQQHVAQLQPATTRKRPIAQQAKPAQSHVQLSPASQARQQEQPAVQPTNPSSPTPQRAFPVVEPQRQSSGLHRETSSRSFRSQVMYDVTTSHRPTSPPPRSHKTSLSNLPTLQDLSKGAAQGWQPGQGDRNSTSLISMMETTTRMHDQLAEGDPSQKMARAPIPEEETSEDFEDVAVEDGFGGFMWERRRIPRSQSHDVLSSAQQARTNQQQYDSAASLQSPMSIQSEPTGDRDREEPGMTWSRLPGEEPFVSPDLIDDVAAQAQAATRALKGEQDEKPRVRTKSLGRKARRNLASHISQPQLLSTSQRMEHTKQIAAVDSTLRKKEQSLRSPLPPFAGRQQMRSTTPNLTTQMARSGSMNTARSPSASPTDYKLEETSRRKASNASGHLRRSSSFGHQGRLDGAEWPISPAQSASTAGQNKASPGTPQSDRSQTGLSRLMSRFRRQKANDLPAVIEPYPSSSGKGEGRQLSAARSSPALSGPQPNTPGSLSSPAFQTPKESPAQFSASPKTEGFGSRLPMPQASYTPLADLFSSPIATPPPRSTSHGATLNGGKAGMEVAAPSSGSDALAPAAPIHARSANANQDGAREAAGTLQPNKQNARDTVVRRTIIVSTYDPAEERRKSTSTGLRKNSLRKPVDRQSVQPNGHKRASSTSSSKAGRRSLQDRPPTPPGPDGVSGTHRRKLSQDINGQPLPATARNVYEAPLPQAGHGGLGVPSMSSNAARASSVSGYGASLYDMYIDDDDETQNGKKAGSAYRQSALAPPDSRTHGMARQSSDGGARHIEVTERADGSVVWQVIAGLADRSSTYSASVGYPGGHSRQTSDTSQYSFMRNGAYGTMSPAGRPNALADEDGRSLFARTRGKKSFSIDGENVPPLPGTEMGATNMQDSQTDVASPPQQLDFEMATSPGQAATRIVYTSDAELAAMLESLAGPDKSSAKFAFQRVVEQSRSNDEKVAGQTAEQSTMSTTPSEDVSAAASNAVAAMRAGRPVSIFTDGELANDPTGALRNQRFKIEAEIYSLLQREHSTGDDLRPSISAAAPPSSDALSTLQQAHETAA